MKLTQTSTNLISIAAIVIIIAAARWAQEIVIPFLLAVFVSIIAASPVTWLRNKGVPPALAVTTIVVMMVGLMLIGTLLLATSVNSFSNTLPQYLDRLRGVIDQLIQWLAGFGLSLSSTGIRSALDPGAAMRFANTLFNSLAQLLSNTFLMLLTVILMLLEASAFSTKINLIRNDAGQTLAQISRFLDTTKQYMAIKAFTSLVTGILIGMGMVLLGVDYAVLWGFLAFLLNFIPTIGSIIAAVPAVLLAMLQLGFGSALAVAAVFLAVNMIIGNILEPRIMGRGMGLSTLVVFLSLVFWGWLFGPIGMLLSVPLTMMIKIGTEYNESTRWIAIMLSTPPSNVDSSESSSEPA
ncbi:AI-2E family transporter [Kaarinaea lacus]